VPGYVIGTQVSDRILVSVYFLTVLPTGKCVCGDLYKSSNGTDFPGKISCLP
jgi:hypothetical protein